MAGAGVPFAVRVGQERRRTRDEQAHVRARLLGQPLMIQQADIEGRHAHHRRGLRHQAHDLVRIEFRQEDHRRAGHQRDVGRHEQPMGVEDGQRVQQHVVGREAPVIDQRQRVGGQVVVAQHRALGAARGARRVEDGGEIVRSAVDVGEGRSLAGRERGERPLPLGVQRLHRRAAGDRLDAVELGGIAHDQRRLGVADEIVQFGQRVGVVERQEDRAGPHAGQIGHQHGHRFFDLHGHPVAGLHAERDEGVGVGARRGFERAIAHQPAVRMSDERSVRGGHAGADQVEEMIGHGVARCDPTRLGRSRRASQFRRPALSGLAICAARVTLDAQRQDAKRAVRKERKP